MGVMNHVRTSVWLKQKPPKLNTFGFLIKLNPLLNHHMIILYIFFPHVTKESQAIDPILPLLIA